MFLLLAGIISSQFVQAQYSDEASGHSTVMVKYIGGDQSSLVFNVKYANKEARSVNLVALSESGDVWFQETYRMSKELDKKLSIPRLTETGYIVFLLRSSADEKELTYTVTVPRNETEDSPSSNQ